MPKECSVERCGRPSKARAMCSSHYEKWRRYGDPESVPARTANLLARMEAQEKPCVTCGLLLPFDAFFSDSSRADGRATSCAACKRSASKSWRTANPDKARRRSTRTAAQVERDRALTAKWKRENPHRVTAYLQKRRAAKAGARSGHVDLDRLWRDSGSTCGICGDSIDRDLRHPDPMSPSLDHILPLSMGGAHAQGNVQWTHLVCNLRKGARPGDSAALAAKA